MADTDLTADSATTSSQPSSSQKKRLGYYNIQREADLSPSSTPLPDYLSCTTNRRRAPVHPRPEEGYELLPPYDCTVSAYACASLKIEKTTPFNVAEDAEWQNVFLSLRGTMLCVYAAEVPSTSLLRRLASRSRHTLVPGALTRAYSLQHGCVGVASDMPKTDMIPKHEHWKSFSEATLARLREKEPAMFYHMKQYCIRLRLEAEQMLVRFRSRDLHSTWMTRLSESIDIAPAIEDRGEPLLQTCPRRARRDDDLQRAIALSMEEQDGEHESRPESDAPTNAPRPRREPAAASNPERDLEQLVRQIHYSMGTWSDGGDGVRLTPFKINTSTNTVQPSDKPTVNDDGEAAQFHRRAPPSLFYDSPYASKVVLKDGKLWLADPETETLIPHGATPPAYEEVPTSTRPQTLELLSTLAEGSSDSISSTISISAAGEISRTLVVKQTSEKNGPTWSLRGKNRSRSNTTSSKKAIPANELDDDELRLLTHQMEALRILGMS